MGDALGGFDCDWVSWFSNSLWVCSFSIWCLVVVVSFWVHSSCVMMMVPPPWAMSRSRSSDGAAGVWNGAGIGLGVISGAAGLGNAGVCIGRKVMVVVVFLLSRMLFARLSIDWVVLVVVVDWVLHICLVLRQAVVIRSMMATDGKIG